MPHADVALEDDLLLNHPAGVGQALQEEQDSRLPSDAGRGCAAHAAVEASPGWAAKRFTTTGQWAIWPRQLGPETIEKLHRRVVEIAQENKIASGRKMRVDTTVVETDIHYPTDSTPLGDGVRVLTRIMKKVSAVAGELGTRMRDRSRSARLKVLAIARSSRNKTEQVRKMKKAYLQVIGNRHG